MSLNHASTPVIAIPMVNISAGRVVAFTKFEGVNRKKKRLAPTLYRGEDGVDTPSTQNFAGVELDWESVVCPEPYEGDDPQERDMVNAIREGYYEYQMEKRRLDNLKDNKPTVMSVEARKKVINCINNFFLLSEEKPFTYTVKKGRNKGQEREGRFRLNMITLTLCADEYKNEQNPELSHDDEFIKKYMLNRFLEQLRRKHGLRTYIWRAEIQEKKTNRIHFHIITNIYVKHTLIRKYWNDIQRQFGYIDRYIARGGNGNPNGTDVHAVYKVKKLCAYLSKYMAKGTSATARPISGRQWYCSTNLSRIKPISVVNRGEIYHELIRYGEEHKHEWKEFPYSFVMYAHLHSADLTNYPTLSQLTKDWRSCYFHTLNYGYENYLTALRKVVERLIKDGKPLPFGGQAIPETKVENVVFTPYQQSIF